MVKKRIPGSSNKQPTVDQIEAFTSAADGGYEEKPAKKNDLDPNAPRNFKEVRVPFNEYEFNKLEELKRKTGRSRNNLLRWAILKIAEETE